MRDLARRRGRGAVRQGHRRRHGDDRARRPAAVRLAPLRKLRALDALSATTTWSRMQRANLIDPMAPNPSVEMLLHAFLPHKFVDHTHATAVLSLIDQPDGEKQCATRFIGGRARLRALRHAGLRPRQEGGRGLRASEPEVDGLILRQARHLHLRRERARSLRAHDRDGHARRGAARAATARRCSSRRTAAARRRRAAQVAPIVRGACSLKDDDDRRRLAPARARIPRQRRDPQFRQRRGAWRATARPAW